MAPTCSYCAQPLPHSVTACPHCGQPSLYPNVRAADEGHQVDALKRRFAASERDAETRGVRTQFDQLLAHSDSAEAVINRPHGEVTRLARADSEIYATFYQRTDAGIQIPAGNPWDKLRAVADTILFGEENKRHVRFAALTLDGCGLPHYGDCSITLRTSMIAHRTSLIEENSAIFMKRHGVTATDDYKLPVGHLASWTNRKMLVAAKLTPALSPTTQPADFPKLLLAAGKTSSDDRFVEAHIWGSITVRTMSKVTITKWQTKPRKSEVKALEEKLGKYNVAFTKPS